MKIETTEQYDEALRRANELMNAEADTPEADELAKLVDAIMEWEDIHYPINREEDDYENDGQPDEAQEWYDFDSDC